MVFIGPTSILDAGHLTHSPFNVSNILEKSYFSENETKDLFQRFQTQSGKLLEEGIVEDIYYRTQGHPGLTCFCGKKIDEALHPGSGDTLSLKMAGLRHVCVTI